MYMLENETNGQNHFFETRSCFVYNNLIIRTCDSVEEVFNKCIN